MSGGVGTAEDDSFLIPVHPRTDVCGTVSQRETAAATIGIVCIAPVQQEIAVDRDFSCGQFLDRRRSELFGSCHGLIEDVVFVGSARAIR